MTEIWAPPALSSPQSDNMTRAPLAPYTLSTDMASQHCMSPKKRFWMSFIRFHKLHVHPKWFCLCKYANVLHRNASMSMQKLSTPDTLMSLLIDPPPPSYTQHWVRTQFPQQCAVLNFWVWGRGHNRKGSWHEREESPWGSSQWQRYCPHNPPTPHIQLDLEYTIK